MIFGSLTLHEDALVTHRNSYRLHSFSVVSVDQPLLPCAKLFSLGLGGFSIAFADLLYIHEMVVIGALAVAGLKLGYWLAVLKLGTRDLRRSDFSNVIWGSFAHLNQYRDQIMPVSQEKAPKEAGAS